MQQSLLHWFYVAVMAISAFSFISMSASPKGVPQYKYVIHTFVVVWSGLAYSAMAMGQGITEAFGETVYYARYIDWVITTPLLLLSLNLTSKYTIDVEGGVTGTLLGTQTIMILTGLVAEFSPHDIRWFWYIAGCVTLIVVLYLFWGPLYLKAKEQDPAITDVYRKSAIYLTVQWILYPVAWALGAPGVEVIGTHGTTWAFIILPIISKAGFGFYNLYLLRNLPEHLKMIHAHKATHSTTQPKAYR